MNTLPNNLNQFMDDDGRINGWPAKRTKQLAILQYLAEKFQPSFTYTEAQINDILNQWHTFGDWSLLRRDMVDAGLLERDAYGHEYKLVPRLEPDEDQSLPLN